MATSGRLTGRNAMKKTIAPSKPQTISVVAAYFSLTMSCAALGCLAGLHILSPEFDPAWRVVSEYALGGHGWVLSSMFLAWALSSWALVLAIHSQVRTFWGKVGLVFLVIAGAGEALAAPFDVTYPVLHGSAGLLGVPTMPIAAMLITVSLGSTPAWAATRRRLLWMANLTWVSLALLVAAMLTLSGSIFGVQVPIGWPNRLLVGIYVLWAMSIAWQVLRLRSDGWTTKQLDEGVF
jgi:hypothetical protein